MSDQQIRTVQIRTVAVVGAGALGAMYAAFFARAGLDTLLVAGGERAERLRSPGLSVNGERLAATVVDPHAEGGKGPVPRADLVIVAVKHEQLPAALEDAAPLVGAQTAFLSVLNGLDSEQTIADRFGAEKVLLCVALAMDVRRDGARVTFQRPGRLRIGTSSDLGTGDRLRSVAEVLDRAGLAHETPQDMRRAVWWKFLMNTSTNQPSAVMRAPYGDFQRDGPARALMFALMDEVIAVARAEGVDLGADDIAACVEVVDGQTVDGFTSTAQDVLAGRPTEVDIFGGRVVELGQKHGIDVPYNQTMVWLLS